LVNRTDQNQVYTIAPDIDDYEIEVINEELLELSAGDSHLVPVHLTFPSSLTHGRGQKTVTATISDTSENMRQVEFSLVGPK
jgi:hypothetical protein